MLIEKDTLVEKNIHLKNIYDDAELAIHFAGVTNWRDRSDLPMHRDEGFEICVIPSGKGFFRIGDTAWPISAGQITLSKPLDIHTCWPSKDDPFSMYFICFSFKDWLPRSSPLYRAKERLEEITRPVRGDGYRLHEHIRRIIYEAGFNDAYTGELMRNELVSLLLNTLRCFEKAENNLSAGPMNEKDDLAGRVISYIDGNLGPGFDLDTMGKALNYSVPHLSRHFRQQTGYSIKEYYNMMRLEQARKELSEGIHTITSVAEKYGFYDIQHFSKAFKHYFGMSPSKALQNDD